MRWKGRLASGIAAALLQACASSSPSPEPAERSPAPSAPPAIAKVPAASAAPAVPAGTGLLKSAPLPPFEWREVKEPLRGITTIDRTAPVDDLWQRVRQGFAMPNLDNELVAKNVAWYAARPDYLQRVFERSRIYLYHIVEELEKRGLPTELALLPIVESAFNPMAYSRAHASGLWQFIPDTGRRFELKQNWWYDGRRDIVDSTNAALDYLTYLYDLHGDWQLALASYNWGEGAVTRAMARNRARGLPADYANLSMPAETRNYLPKLQALKNIIADPVPFGVVLDPIPNQPYFTFYTRLRDIDVQLAAKLAEMPVEQFIALNPGFSRPVIRASVTPRIVLPADRIELFHANLEKYDGDGLVSWKTYRPKKGETLEAIARRFHMSLAQLKEVNGIGARTRAVPTLLVVPTSSEAVHARKLPIMYAPPIPVAVRRIYHTVRTGDSLASIARRYGVSVENLKRWNPGARATPGRKLAIELRAAPRGKSRPKGKPKRYRTAAR